MTIHIPTPLRTYTEGNAEVSILAGTVADALKQLVEAYPGLRANLYGADGKLRSFVNIYLNDEDIRYLNMKEDSPTSPSDELTIIPSIAGGTTLQNGHPERSAKRAVEGFPRNSASHSRPNHLG